jgi:hypothetical protein
MAQNLAELKKNYGDGVISRREFIQQGAIVSASVAGIEEGARGAEPSRQKVISITWALGNATLTN